MIRVLIVILSLSGCGTVQSQTRPASVVETEVWEQGSPEFVPSCGSTAKCQRTDSLWDEGGQKTKIVSLPRSACGKAPPRCEVCP